MNFRDRPRSIWALPALVLALAIVMLAFDWGGIASGLRGTLFDSYQRAAARPYQDTSAVAGLSVRVLDVDTASVARFGPWPWPHAVLAKLTRDLKAQGAVEAAGNARAFGPLPAGWPADVLPVSIIFKPSR